MRPDEEITVVAETVLALDEEPPYTADQRETFYKAAKFFKDWGEQAFQLDEAELEAEGMTQEQAIKSVQPILAISIELVRMAAGAPPTVERDVLQDRIREYGQAAVKGLQEIALSMAVGPEEPVDESFQAPDEPDGRMYY